MNYSELVQNLVKPGSDIVASMSDSKANLMHMAIGVSGEVAELLQAIILQDEVNVKEEFGDIEFYLEGMCQELDWRPDVHEITDVDKEQIDDFCIPSLIIFAGELLDSIKKMWAYDQVNLDKIEKSLQTFSVAMQLSYSFCNIDREECIHLNFDKLSKRCSSGKYSDKEAAARADKQ